ncbi:MAG TPA: DegT/DnrJ/EryC1/StrS family aminotransferase [Thermoleophilaceae bacterium]|nr:DegT/DnrJ/EryC1/StrS family aminotransferase [Thermoleophilaceae bacterium]
MDVAAAVAALESGWLTMGPRTEAFERAFSAHVGSPEAVATTNGTAALHLALVASGIGPGDEVIVPAITFVATAAAVIHAGAEPVICDVISPQEPLADPEAAAALVGPRTKAVVLVHFAGFPCDPLPWRRLAQERDLLLIEDAAHAAGTAGCGTLGRAAAFSFFSNKNLAVGEGGMLVTSDPEIAARARSLRSHGMSTGTWERHTGVASGYEVAEIGFNYRIDELRAALGVTRLGRLESEAGRRREALDAYRERLGAVEGVDLVFGEHALDGVAPHLACALVAPTARAGVRESLRAHGIQTSMHYPPLHQLPPLRMARRGDLSRSEEYASRTLTLPLHPHLDSAAVADVSAALLGALARPVQRDVP